LVRRLAEAIFGIKILERCWRWAKSAFYGQESSSRLAAETSKLGRRSDRASIGDIRARPAIRGFRFNDSQTFRVTSREISDSTPVNRAA